MPTPQRLAERLDELAGFLEAHPPAARSPFAAQIRTAAREVAASDAHGARRFLALFGGMGSLNDITYHPANGNAAGLEEAARLQARFGERTQAAYDLARDLLP